MEDKDDLLDGLIDEESNNTNGTSDKRDPRPGDEDWEEFVLSKLTSREVDENGRPSTAGLRRIAPKLLGKIIDSGPVTVFNPTQDNDHRATIVYELVYVNKDYVEGESDENERIIRVREVSDAWDRNIDGDDFKKHPTAIASTRAEGRALRKALLLSVAVKEEISVEEYVPTPVINENAGITSTQKHSIQNLCKRYKIDLNGLIKWGKDDSIEDVSKEKAANIVRFLNNPEKRATIPSRLFYE